MQAAALAEEAMALKEQVQTAEMAKQLQQAHMDRDRAVEVEQLKAQVQLGLAEREGTHGQTNGTGGTVRPVCLKQKLWCTCNAD